MATGSTTYLDPSVYQNEIIVPSGINLPALPFAVCLIGTGSRNKRVNNEPVLRGIVLDEPIVPGSPSGQHTVALANRSIKTLDTTEVTKTLNSIPSVVPDSYVSFDPAFVLGTVTSAVDLSTTKAFGLELDKKTPVTMVLADRAPVVIGGLTFAISGSTITLTRGSGSWVTDGVLVGAKLYVTLSEDTPNNGTFDVLSVSATQLTYENALGANTTAAPDDTAAISFSTVGLIGRQITVTTSLSGTAGATATMAEISAAINLGLAAASSLGFGSTYANVASVSTNALKLTSPLSSPTSDVRVFDSITASALTVIFGAAGTSNRDAQSIIRISDAAYNASATYAVEYVRTSGDLDPLAQTTDVQRIVSVGSYPGGTNFAPGVDWQLTSASVDWSPDAPAVITGIAGTVGGSPNKGFLLGTNLTLALRIADTDINITLSAMSSPPLGYTNLGSVSDAKASELAANVNAVLASTLGPRYATVASVVAVDGTNRLRLTSPDQGQAASSITVKAATSNSAHALIFGGTSSVLGTGKRPVAGTAYYVSYEYTRPTADYDMPFRHFSVETALAQVGNPSVLTSGYNPLAIATQIAFENGSQFVYTIQINDSTAEGNPTRTQVKSAIDGAATLAGTTEIIVIGEPGTRLDVTTDLIDHLETQNGSIEKHYRRLFCGMASDTAIGDRDTSDTIVYRATRTLQVSPTSPARGRMFMLAPPQQVGVTRNILLDDSTEARVSLDTTYLAVAVAAKRTALAGPAETLTRKTVTGFNTDDIVSPWKPAERRQLAGNGVLVVTYDAGRFMVLDAMSTEGGGGGKESFKVDSTSYQKDIIVTKINQALDTNIIGIVPYDLASFLLDIKLVIQGAISNEISLGTIGPYRDKTTGIARAIDLRVDISVSQNVNTPTEYNFSYYFNLRYPALRLFGTYTVDSPWSSAA